MPIIVVVNNRAVSMVLEVRHGEEPKSRSYERAKGVKSSFFPCTKVFFVQKKPSKASLTQIFELEKFLYFIVCIGIQGILLPVSYLPVLCPEYTYLCSFLKNFA